MTCNQLAGACDTTFHAATFEEMGGLCKIHAMDMAAKGDKAHIEKMEEMKNNYMTKPEEVQKWFSKMKQEFDALPED
ncbi:MAG: DUF1059 domain-containing protein [Patescibacteria group bacterium]